MAKRTGKVGNSGRSKSLDKKNIEERMREKKRQLARAKTNALRDHGQAELTDIRQRIQTRKTDPYRTRWAPWSFATRQQRIREGTATRGILFRTGALLRSFYIKINNNKLMILSNSRYARFLNDGSRRMRPRVLIDLASKLSRNRFNKILSENIKRYVK